MHSALRHIAHRPWPVPATAWTWRQTWHDLLFAHWPVPAAALVHLVPPSLHIQEFQGTSWVGVVPFRMTGVMRRGLPNLPGVSAFPELNLRLYVECQGRPGVWFLSLDAANLLAVWAARRFFHLPYYRAHIHLVKHAGEYHFSCERAAYRSPMRCEARYQPCGEVHAARPGTLEHFLCERYCLYTQSPAGHLLRLQIHHKPWPLQLAQGAVEPTELLEHHGLSVDHRQQPPVLHFARRLDVVLWPFENVQP